MSTNRSIDEVLASLEAQVAFFREREAYHAQQVEHHQVQRDSYAAELEKVSRHLEAFRAAAGHAVQLSERTVAPSAPNLEEDLGSASRPRLGQMVERVLLGLPAGARFGVKLVAAEVNRLFGDRLRKPMSEQQASVVLRRLLQKGRIERFRAGRPHWEALYVLTPSLGSTTER